MEQKKHPEYQYLDLLRDVLENGHEKFDYATKTKFKGVFGRQTRYDLSEGFPLLTTKRVFYKGIIHELIWFFRGETNLKYLVDNNVHIWDDWAYKSYKKAVAGEEVPFLTQDEFIQKIREGPAENTFVKRWGELGPVYGRMWRKWPAPDGRQIDQLKWAIWKLNKESERERKHICVSAWNPEFIYEMSKPGTEMALPPCHCFFQFDVQGNELICQLYQRSADLFLGVPFNIASYALLTMSIAQVTGLKPREFIHTFGNVHLYENHYQQAREQLSREPRSFPHMVMNPAKKSIDDFVYEDFEVKNYNPHPPLKGEITVVGGFDESQRGVYEKGGPNFPPQASLNIPEQ